MRHNIETPLERSVIESTGPRSAHLSDKQPASPEIGPGGAEHHPLAEFVGWGEGIRLSGGSDDLMDGRGRADAVPASPLLIPPGPHPATPPALHHPDEPIASGQNLNAGDR